MQDLLSYAREGAKFALLCEMGCRKPQCMPCLTDNQDGPVTRLAQIRKYGTIIIVAVS